MSNFFLHPIIVDGCTYRTNEHAFQAMKTFDHLERMRIATAETPGASKRMGRRVALRPDWEKVKDEVMLSIVRCKFQDKELAGMLIATGDAELVEGNTWGDRYWGVDGTGKNRLGEILMKVRAELRE